MNRHNLPWLDTPWEPDALREQGFQELMDGSAEFADATEGLLDRLGAIRVSLSDGGIDVTVTVDGQLVELALTDEAVELGGAGLAAAIRRLTTEAAQHALSQGIAVLTPVVGIELAEQLSAATGLDAANAEAKALAEAEAAAEAGKAAAKPDPVRDPTRAAEPAADPEPVRAPARRRPAPVDDDEDYSTVQTWAVTD